VVGVKPRPDSADFHDSDLTRALFGSQSPHHGRASISWRPCQNGLFVLTLHLLNRHHQAGTIGLSASGDAEAVTSLMAFKASTQTVDQARLAMQVQDGIVLCETFDLAIASERNVNENLTTTRLLLDLHR